METQDANWIWPRKNWDWTRKEEFDHGRIDPITKNRDLIMNNWHLSHLTIWIGWNDWINTDKHLFDYFHQNGCFIMESFIKMEMLYSRKSYILMEDLGMPQFVGNLRSCEAIATQISCRSAIPKVREWLGFPSKSEQHCRMGYVYDKPHLAWVVDWWGYPLVNVYITNWKDPPFLLGKLTISMAIFNSYVCLPEGTSFF